ncbi:MAG TPA: ATP-binding cassette domain-containing protein, partial [Streptosporangiaceae bacterium]
MSELAMTAAAADVPTVDSAASAAGTAGTAAGTAVAAEGLRKVYKSRAGEVCALDGLGFSVAAGSVFALLGPNGAGKTTTVRILTTLTRPDAGRVTVAGIDVLKSPGRVRSVIGAVGQSSGAVTDLTGYENL